MYNNTISGKQSDAVEEIFKYFYNEYKDNSVDCQIVYNNGIKIIVDDSMVPILISRKTDTIKFKRTLLGVSDPMNEMSIWVNACQVRKYINQYMDSEEVEWKRMRYIVNPDNGWFYSGDKKCRYTGKYSFMFSPQIKYYFKNAEMCRSRRNLIRKSGLNAEMI